MNEIVRELQIQSEAARVLVANIRDVIGEDDQAAADMIEGETHLHTALSRAFDRHSELSLMVHILKVKEDDLKKRRERFERQAEFIRTAMASAMEQASLQRLELPDVTLSLRPMPQKAVVIDEAAIPTQFWKRQDPKIDLRALTKALKEGPVLGATLSNGGRTIQFRME